MEKEFLDGSFCEGFFGYAKIYTLHGLNTLPFYVGCTVTDIEDRLSGHITYARMSAKIDVVPSAKDRIIIANYFQISATIVDMIWVTGANKSDANKQARFLEMRWVEKLKKEGFELCNIHLADTTTSRIQYIGKEVYAA